LDVRAYARDCSVRVERRLGLDVLVARVAGVDRVADPRPDPLDRPLELHRPPGGEHVAGIQPEFAAECAADVRNPDVDPVFGQRQDSGERAPGAVGLLAADVDDEFVVCGPIARDRGLGRHRERHETVVHQLEVDGSVGARKRGLDGVFVADRPLEGNVVGSGLVDCRCSRVLRAIEVGNGVVAVVLDDDVLDRVVSEIPVSGDNCGDGLSLISDAILDQNRIRRCNPLIRAVGRHSLVDPGGSQILGRVDRQHAVSVERVARVDATDVGVCVLASDQCQVDGPRILDVVQI
jgi:hypothetical protein